MRVISDTYIKYLYLILIVIILSVGILFRLTDIDKRVLFTDEAVHYNFIHDLWKSQQYQNKSIESLSYLNTVNVSLNVYESFVSAMDNDSVWSIKNTNYKNYISLSSFISSVFNPYDYAKHLINNSAYKYDPVYHGPFIYYVGDLVFNIAGKHSIYLLRLPMAISSVLALFYIFLYRRFLGNFGFVVTLSLVALSSGLVYYSDLANYEDYISTLNILGVGLLLLGVYKKKPSILFLSGVVLLILMTIKETALIAWFSIVAAFVLMNIMLYIKQRPSITLKYFEDFLINLYKGQYNSIIKPYLLPCILTFIVGLVIFVVLYSSFGGNISGVHDGLTSWMYWKNTGASSGHVKKFGYYTELIYTYDFFLTFLFLSASLIIIFSSRDKYKLFITFWAITLWFVYSVIPYKTPWLIINFLIPFAIVAGIGWEIIYNIYNKFSYRVIISSLIVIMLVNTSLVTIDVKCFRYDDPDNMLTYVHTYREFEEEIKALYTLVMASPDGYNTEVSVAAPEYWPLPSYLFNFTKVGYFGGVKGRDLNINAPIIINDTRDNPELIEYLLESDVNDYVKLRDFNQRPGVNHTIFVKESLMKTYTRDKYHELWFYDYDNNLLRNFFNS
ncbi:MAG: flippase activity-associated protein Agl23 [Vampirovibrionia bacterium]